MSITIREADLEADQEIILRTLANNLPSGADRIDRFHWLYNRNPAGPAISWVAIDTVTKKCIGVAAAFPRRLLVKGVPETAWVLGDFCLNKHYRSLGPALMLQRQCLEGITSGTVPFFYDFPSHSMMRVYHRLGIQEFGKIVRFAKLLRIDRKVEECVKIRVLANILTMCGNFLIRSFYRNPEKSVSLKIISYHGRFGVEFSNLADEIGNSYGTCVVRSAEYLNWRYRDNPLCKYEVLAAYQDVRLVGYVIYRRNRECATLADFFALRDSTIIGCLLQCMVQNLYTQEVVSVSAPVLEGHFLGKMLHRHGFKERETSPLVVYGLGDGATEKKNGRCAEWFIMEGDRDS